MSVLVKSSISLLRNSALSKQLIQSVRFNRKPRWLPIAPSKEFYVRKPTPINPEEYEVLKEKYMFYRSSVKAIRQHLKAQASQDDIEDNVQNDLDETADFNWMEEQVMEWNNNVAVNREDRLATEMGLEEERLQNLMAENAERVLQESIAAEKRLQSNKIASKTFITEENLDIEIEKMLDSRSDYNFALLQDGKIVEGEYPDRSKESSL